jgi:hypothetical protein
MAHYFFDWRDNGSTDLDEDGVDLPDLAAARAEAYRSLLERARDILPGSERHSLSIDVRDEASHHLLSIVVFVEVTFATSDPAAG